MFEAGGNAISSRKGDIEEYASEQSRRQRSPRGPKANQELLQGTTAVDRNHFTTRSHHLNSVQSEWDEVVFSTRIS